MKSLSNPDEILGRHWPFGQRVKKLKSCRKLVNYLDRVRVGDLVNLIIRLHRLFEWRLGDLPDSGWVAAELADRRSGWVGRNRANPSNRK